MLSRFLDEQQKINEKYDEMKKDSEAALKAKLEARRKVRCDSNKENATRQILLEISVCCF